MFQWIKRLFESIPEPIAGTVDDPLLGTLSWSVDYKMWASDAAHGVVGFRFLTQAVGLG